MTDAAPPAGDPHDLIRSAVACLVDTGIPVMVLAEAVRDPAAGGRDDAPLDLVAVLVPPDCQAEAVESLTLEGWSLLRDAGSDAALGWVATRHTWPLTHGRTRIDLYHFATVFNRLRNDDDRLWRFSAPLSWRGLNLRTPRREHALLLALVEGLTGPIEYRTAWFRCAARVLHGPPLDWPELLHDIRLRYLEAIMHAGLARLAQEQAAPVPSAVLAQLAVESSPAQRAELVRRAASTRPVSDDDARQDFEVALTRYRRRREFSSPAQAAHNPSATLSLALPSDGATAWITIPSDRVSTDWLVLTVSCDLPSTVFDGRTALRLTFPGLPIGAVPVAPPTAGPPQRFTAMLPFHQGFLGARGVDKLGIVFVRDGLPVVWGRPVSVQVDCLMAVTAAESAAGRPPPAAEPAPPSTQSATSSPRLVLCRPRGGLNDTLNQVEHCWDYAERFGRRLIVDAWRSGLRAAFSDYFCVRDAAADVMLHPSPADVEAFDCLPAEPPALTGRISTYSTQWDSRLGHSWQSGHLRVPVRFDRDRNYGAALLLHEQSGGGRDSLAALRRLRFTAEVAAIIRSRVVSLGTGYIGLHLRQTDNPIDAQGFLLSLRESLAGCRVLVCSDDPAIVAKASDILHASEVFAASLLQDSRGTPQHVTGGHDAFPDPAARRRANLDALVDLVALARADRVVLSRGYSGTYSGFGMLAKLLCEHRDVLDGMLG